MASIQRYLQALEARLAPTLEAGALRERLTEAENHLLDRAQEFEEIGLPPHEAEARAVAAFGQPEEYAEDVPPIAVPTSAPVSVSRDRAPERHGAALQLAWCAVGLGLVGMLTISQSAWMAGGAAVLAVGLGALSGRTISLRRLGVLAVVASAAAFPILNGFYEPLPSSAYEREHLGENEHFGVQLRGATSQADYPYRYAKEGLARFQQAQAAFVANGNRPVLHNGLYQGPPDLFNETLEVWPPSEVVEGYSSEAEATRMWAQHGVATQQRLKEILGLAKPIAPNLVAFQWDRLCALVAVAGGVSLLAAMVAAQVVGLAIHGFFARLLGAFRRGSTSQAQRRARFEPDLRG